MPKKLWADKGSEFYNKNVTELLKKHNIERYSTQNLEKSMIVERWNRTIKRKMWVYFTTNNTHKYIDILPDLIAQYNNTYHRTIGCTPTVASKPESYKKVFKKVYGKVKLKPTPKLKVGDNVRISKYKTTFSKGYTPNWTEEIFIVKTVKNTNPPTYGLEDLKGEDVTGGFYEQELQKIEVKPEDEYRVEKVLRHRTRNGIKEARVKWKGYDNSFNSWEPAKNVH